MSYRVRAEFYIDYVGDGVGPMEVPGSPTIKLLTQFSGGTAPPLQGPIAASTIVPGGNTPTQGNFNTAFTAVATDMQNQLSANGSALLTRIQGFATGTQG